MLIEKKLPEIPGLFRVLKTHLKVFTKSIPESVYFGGSNRPNCNYAENNYYRNVSQESETVNKNVSSPAFSTFLYS